MRHARPAGAAEMSRRKERPKEGETTFKIALQAEPVPHGQLAQCDGGHEAGPPTGERQEEKRSQYAGADGWRLGQVSKK